MSDEGGATGADSSTGDTDTTGQQQESGSSDTGEQTDWKAEAARAAADVEKWRTLARKHETRAKDNADAASKAQTVEEQLESLRKAMADRDIADVEKNGRLALAQVKAQVVGAGFKSDDVAGLFDHIDPMSLLTDGEPDEKAVEKLARSLTKVAGRASVDPDQGRKGGNGPVDMNTLIRRAAGVIT
ncbi:MAG TPA: hypothetical protein VIQ30_24210 [Pseudonocardia sp.]